MILEKEVDTFQIFLTRDDMPVGHRTAAVHRLALYFLRKVSQSLGKGHLRGRSLLLAVDEDFL